jgi:hypothetical protein
MSRRAAALAVATLAAALAAGPARASSGPVAITVTAKRGAVAAARAELNATALRVQRQNGRELQIAAPPARLPALRRLPGIAAARPATAGFEDAVVVGEGFDRTGAAALEPVGDGGRGLRIAILDMGFGAGWTQRQTAGELPPSNRLELRSFDALSGIAGRNAYGNVTNHGELVAQTVYDYAPNARYILVSYHTVQDFLAAVDYLIARRPDIVVHSNSFLEGPFDGTGAAAQAVDRAAAAGILWFNSAGNYAGKHWSGAWSDANGDGALDWPNGDIWTFDLNANQPISFALSWNNPAGVAPSDLDLVLERQGADGTWVPLTSSTDRQSPGAPAAERITGYLPREGGRFRLRVTHVAGPAPTGPLTLFSREIDLSPIGDSVTASLPTPGDANGSVTIGAVDWRGNVLKGYSSQGPTADGRAKPDFVAPTNTRVAGPAGTRAVGGTSIAAPNAAGAAALLLSTQRALGEAPTAETIRANLAATALDLGLPGPDPAYGLGMLRVDADPPQVVPGSPLPDRAVRGFVRALFGVEDGSRIAVWSMALDGVAVQTNRSGDPVARRIDTRRLPDGPHVLSAQARDWAGNIGAGQWAFLVDNTRPTVAVPRVQVPPAPSVRLPQARTAPAGRRGNRVRRPPPPPPPRPVLVTVRTLDGASVLPVRVVMRLAAQDGATVASRSLDIRPGSARRVGLGRQERGVYRLQLVVSDRAGNKRGIARGIRVS